MSARIVRLLIPERLAISLGVKCGSIVDKEKIRSMSSARVLPASIRSIASRSFPHKVIPFEKSVFSRGEENRDLRRVFSRRDVPFVSWAGGSLWVRCAFYVSLANLV